MLRPQACARRLERVVPAMTKGALIIDSSTIDVESARQAPCLASKSGVLSVDAPVSGGTGGARAQRSPSCAAVTTRPFAGGDAKPVLETWARRSCIAAAMARGRRRKSATHDSRHFHDRGERSLCALARSSGFSHQALFDVASTSRGSAGRCRPIARCRARCRPRPPTTITSGFARP